MFERIKPYLKAAGAAVVCAAGYLANVIPDGGVGDMSQKQWLGLVVFMGAAYDITFFVPYASTKDRG